MASDVRAKYRHTFTGVFVKDPYPWPTHCPWCGKLVDELTQLKVVKDTGYVCLDCFTATSDKDGAASQRR